MVIKVRMDFQYDGTLPRDVVTITPHFFGTDPDALLAALKTNLNAWAPTAGKPYTLRAYDAEKLPPSFPIASASQTGTVPSSQHPREVAICLSYYSTYNRPRLRGRLYLPASWFTAVASPRPSQATTDSVLTFATQVLTKQLPASHNWVVWSRRDSEANGVTNIWCDDEWDTVRSRGLRGTRRSLGTV